jgi:peptidoglycan/LPS O-acetylase OafA/YrhL
LPSPARGDHRLDELEGQRGLAAVLVVVFHAYQYDRSGPTSAFPYEGSPQHALLVGLDGAVSWFFVLSAFLLARPYVRAVLAGRPATPARTFLARRAVRIVPLYVVAVTVVWAWRNPGCPATGATCCCT